MRLVPIQNGINFRELGGIAVDGGKVKPGMLFRSGALSTLTTDDRDFLANQLRLTSILDYRDETEIKVRPDILWPGANYYHFPANPLSTEVSADLEQGLNDNIKGTDLKKFYPHDFMLKLYRLLPFNNPAYKQLINLLTETEIKPMLQHCAVGKDRTGIGVAITLFSLGADEDTVMEDYLLTEKILAEFREKILQEFAEQLTDVELESHRNLFAAKEAYLAAALTAVKEKYQTIDNWLAHEYGVNKNIKAQLQEKYLA